jgi:anaerobic selenocysteine-containing dehydrogenase
VDVVAKPTDTVMPGVVCLPHGWGHDRPGTRTRVAREHAGVSVNAITDEQEIDPLSGTAVLNGVPVTLAAVSGAESGAESATESATESAARAR